MLAREAFFDKFRYLICNPRDCILRAGQSNHLGEDPIRHVEHIRRQNIVILFFRKAQALKQGGDLHDFTRGAVAAP